MRAGTLRLLLVLGLLCWLVAARDARAEAAHGSGLSFGGGLGLAGLEVGPDHMERVGPEITPANMAARLLLDHAPRLDGDRPFAVRHLREIAGRNAHLFRESRGASTFCREPGSEVHVHHGNCICYRLQAAFAITAVAMVPG